MSQIELSYCIVNTSQRELMLRGLDALLRERATLPFASEVLVLDNGSRDGSAQAAREHAAVDEVIALEQRQGKALNDSELLPQAGVMRCCSTRTPSCRPVRPWRCTRRSSAIPTLPLRGPGCCVRTAPSRPAPGAFQPLSPPWQARCFLQRAYTVQSKGGHTREVDWCESSALLVRREAAAQIDYLDPDFFVYSDEVDFARRLRDVGCAACTCQARRRSTTSSSRPARCRSDA